MKRSLDKAMLYVAYIYFSLPFLIFVIGWLRWYYAVIISAAIIVSFFLSLGNHTFVENINLKKHTKKILIAIAVILVWVYFSGIGCYSYQNEDHQCRNAIFHDLINYKWPVVYNVNLVDTKSPLQGKECLLTYYIGYWLPAAVVGKILNWQAANFFLYLWTVLGLTLTFYFICRAIKKFSLKALWVFIFFSSLYFLGSFLKFSPKSIITEDYTFWVNIWFADSSTDFYWVFNQTITSYVIIMLIMNDVPRRNLFFISAFCLFQAPFVFLGLIPFMVYIVFKDVFQTAGLMNMLRRLLGFFSFQNITGIALVAIPTVLYMSGNTAAQHFAILHYNVLKYALCIGLTFGLVSLLLLAEYRNNIYLILSIVILLIVPFIQVGYSMDFSGRVSIPAMFILMFLSAKMLVVSKDQRLKKLLAAYVVLSGFTPLCQVGRSVCFTAYSYINPPAVNNYLYNRGNIYNFQKMLSPTPAEAKDKNFLIQDDLKTLANPRDMDIKNFMNPTDKSVFYKYIARRN